MQRQTVEFAVVKKDGIVTRIGRTGVLQPKAGFRNGPARRGGDKSKESDK